MQLGTCRQILASFFVALWVMGPASRSFAAVLNLKDLDELCFAADDLIEGHRGTTGVDVEVLAVYSGSLKPGQHTLVDDLRYYVKRSQSRSGIAPGGAKLRKLDFV